MEELQKLWQDFVGEMCMSHDLSKVMKDMPIQGCCMKVVQSRDPKLVHKEGILIQHSADFVHLASIALQQSASSIDQAVKTVILTHVPKKNSLFSFLLQDKSGQTRLVTLSGMRLK